MKKESGRSHKHVTIVPPLLLLFDFFFLCFVWFGGWKDLTKGPE